MNSRGTQLPELLQVLANQLVCCRSAETEILNTLSGSVNNLFKTFSPGHEALKPEKVGILTLLLVASSQVFVLATSPLLNNCGDPNLTAADQSFRFESAFVDRCEARIIERSRQERNTFLKFF